MNYPPQDGTVLSFETDLVETVQDAYEAAGRPALQRDPSVTFGHGKRFDSYTAKFGEGYEVTVTEFPEGRFRSDYMVEIERRLGDKEDEGRSEGSPGWKDEGERLSISVGSGSDIVDYYKDSSHKPKEERRKITGKNRRLSLFKRIQEALGLAEFEIYEIHPGSIERETNHMSLDSGHRREGLFVSGAGYVSLNPIPGATIDPKYRTVAEMFLNAERAEYK